eukprot:SAG11_NODE_9818_length_878_cov_2.223363_1_plen_102_part_10
MTYHGTHAGTRCNNRSRIENYVLLGSQVSDTQVLLVGVLLDAEEVAPHVELAELPREWHVDVPELALVSQVEALALLATAAAFASCVGHQLQPARTTAQATN